MEYLAKNQYWKINKEYNKEKLLYLLIDRPTGVNIFGEFIWTNNKNQWHRNYDLPAKILQDYSIVWRINDLLHRKNNKPTRIYINGKKEYWLNNRQIK